MSPLGKSSLELEIEIANRLSPWQNEALAIRAQCREFGIAVPPAIARALGITAEVHKDVSPNNVLVIPSNVPNIDKPKRSYNRTAPTLIYKGLQYPSKPDFGEEPNDMESDWAPVPLREATVGLLILFFLHVAGQALSTMELYAALLELRSDSAESTVPMAIPALLKEGWVDGNSKGWTLLKAVKATLIGERLWCSPQIMRGADQAAIRRIAIAEALKVNRKALTVAQVSHVLDGAGWLTVDARPDKVKADLRYMAKLGIAQKNGSAAWSLKV